MADEQSGRDGRREVRAKYLRRGRPISFDGKTMVFLARLRKGKEVSGPTVNVLQCDAYRGLDGRNDIGLCHVSDRQIAEKAAPTTIAELRRIAQLVPALLEEIDARKAESSRLKGVL